MDDLDGALARLAGAPAPAALDDVEARVLARIGARPTLAGAGLGIGVGAPLAGLGGSSPLAPSTLLIGEP
jgi:hypothetical protein